ncbi:unnamed protein product [Aureobasidium vineae]|uniref:Uncharacterized protein n=1 Tax=Aureobasidium vineae TaxID=2773715 RepID=A0A9N8PCH6_9PEZI|nr:unnamed protein product [Aureobasidium vineae]
MPSNTSHIQKRAQLQQHDDLVVNPSEHNEWQDAQMDLGLSPNIRTRAPPVRECAVSHPIAQSRLVSAVVVIM